MKQLILSMLLLSVLLCACSQQVDKVTETAQEVTVIDANTGATGLGAQAAQLPDSVDAATFFANMLKGCDHYFIATVNGNKPAVRPVGLCIAKDGKLWFNLGSAKNSWKQLQANPNIEVCGYNRQTGTTLRLWGEAVMDFSMEEEFLNLAPSLRSIYNKENGNRLGTLWIKNGMAELSEGGITKIYKLGE